MHNEAGYFGNTNFFRDSLLGTLHVEPKQVARSMTVFNLGCTGAVLARCPWVAAPSGITATAAHMRPAAARN